MLFLCLSCSPNSQEEWHLEGESISKKLIVELEQVESIEDLQRLSPKIKNYIHKLTTLSIAAKQYQINHPEEFSEEPLSTHISDILKNELMRIYQIEGASALIEELERDSLHKLDQFSRKVQKRES